MAKKSLLDFLSKDEQKVALERAERRMRKRKEQKGIDIPPELFTIAKVGAYWGWDALMAVRRGYTIETDLDENGNLVYWKNVIELKEVNVLLEAADKVRYSQQVEQIHAGVVAGSFKSGAKTFDGALRPFTDKAEVAK